MIENFDLLPAVEVFVELLDVARHGFLGLGVARRSSPKDCRPDRWRPPVLRPSASRLTSATQYGLLAVKTAMIFGERADAARLR